MVTTPFANACTCQPSRSGRDSPDIPTPRPPALECPAIREHSICHTHVVNDAYAHTTQRRSDGPSGTRRCCSRAAGRHRSLGKAGLSGERVYASSTVKYGLLVSAEWRKEEDGERQLRMETNPPPPPPAVVWMYFNLVPILHGQRLAGMCVNKQCEYTDM